MVRLALLGILLAASPLWSTILTGQFTPMPGSPHIVVDLKLQNCPTGATITGTTLPAPNALELRLTSSNQVVGTITGNDQITCGASPNPTYYLLQVWSGTTKLVDHFVRILGSSVDLSVAPAYLPPTPVPTPTGGGAGNSGGGGTATTIAGITLSTAPTQDGQTFLYDATTNTLSPVAVSYWKRYSIPYSALTGLSGRTGTLTLFTRRNRQKVCGVATFVTSGFSAAGLSAASFTIGDSNSTASFYTPQAVPVVDNGDTNTNVMGSPVGSSSVQATFTAVGANLSTLTAGSVDVDVCLVNLP